MVMMMMVMMVMMMTMMVVMMMVGVFFALYEKREVGSRKIKMSGDLE